MRVFPTIRPESERLMPEITRDRDKVNTNLRQTLNMAIKHNVWPLLLHGAPGTGKTCAALSLTDYCAWAVYETMRSLVNARILAQKGLLLPRKSTYPLNDKQYTQILRGTDLVVIDEVGFGEKASDFERTCLHELLDGRNGRPTILISNRNPQSLQQIYGDAITSRIATGKTYHVTGKDRRLA